MPNTCQLQQELQSLFGLVDADFAYHESDMYLVYSSAVYEHLLQRQPLRVSTFVSPTDSGWNGAGKLCLEVHFAAMDELVEERRSPRHLSGLIPAWT